MNKKFWYLTKVSLKKKIGSKWFIATNIILALVILAIININSIIHIVVDMPKKLPGISKKDTITIIGTSIILNSVNLFGKFIFVVFLS